jgi:hypothetical protein
MPDVAHKNREEHGKYGPGHWEVAALADRQHTMVAHRQLLELGVGQDAIEYRVHVGQLREVFTGVYTIASPELPGVGRLHAAVLSCGPGAVLSHRSAAHLWNVLPTARARPDVTTLRGRCADRMGINVHRVRRLHPHDLGTIDGIPVTSLARTFLDLAEVVSRRRLVFALEKAEKMDVLDLGAIKAVIARSPGRRGLKPLTAAITEIEPEALYSHEGLERLFVEFCRRYEIEMPVMNAVVDGYVVDAYWPAHNLIVELDSWEHHRTRRAFEADRRRDAALTGKVLRVTHRWLSEEPDDLAKTLRRLTASPSLAATA